METATPRSYTEKPDDKLFSIASRAVSGTTKFKYCIEEAKFYIYQDGYWKNIFEMELMMDVVNKINRITQYTLPQRKAIVENMKYLVKMRLENFNKFFFFNLENFMVDPIGGNILAHGEEYYSTIRIPYKYDSLATSPLWDKTLNEIFENNANKVGLFQEFIGSCLCPYVKMKKALLLTGPSNCGKSTLLFTICNLIGEENCSYVPLESIYNAQYTPQMINKLINFDTDVDKHSENYEKQFRTITSCEPIICNQKYVESFKFTPLCKLILAANEFPRITDHTSAFYNRLVLIPCERIFTEKDQNKHLVEDLKEELPGILNWAIVGLKRLRARGMFEEHTFMQDAVRDLENENNPVNAFFDEHVEVVPLAENAWVSKSELYDKYVNWAMRTNNYKLSTNRFSVCVLKKFNKVTWKDAKSPNGKRVWRNLRYIDIKSDNHPPSIGWVE